MERGDIFFSIISNNFEIHEKSDEKIGKSENFPRKTHDFSKKSKNSENFMIFQNRDFLPGNFSDFFDFLVGFFMDCIFFDVLERKMSPLSRKYHVYLRNMFP